MRLRATLVPVGAPSSSLPFVLPGFVSSSLPFPSVDAFVIAAFQNPFSHHGSCCKNLIKAYTSCNEF